MSEERDDMTRILTTEEIYQEWEREWWKRQRRWRRLEMALFGGFVIAVLVVMFVG